MSKMLDKFKGKDCFITLTGGFEEKGVITDCDEDWFYFEKVDKKGNKTAICTPVRNVHRIEIRNLKSELDL